MKIGIVGLPNVGKSTLFKILTKKQVEISNYPFTTISPNKAMVEIPDERLDEIGKIVKNEKKIFSFIEFIDIAGLVKGASKGEGLGNQFLSQIREVDAIIHLVRFFENKEITHIREDINPIEDVEIVNMELSLSDISLIKRRMEKIKGKDEKEFSLLKEIVEKLEKGEKIMNDKIPEDLNLLMTKPVIYVGNISEEDINNPSKKILDFENFLKKQNCSFITICAKIEEEIYNLERDEQEKFFKDLGINISGINKIIKEGYRILDLITFFTIVGEKEIRAWTIKKGTKAKEAAGKIHSDMEKGFIKAEVINYNEFIKAGSWESAHLKGLIKTESKDYVISEGDLIYFKFKV